MLCKPCITIVARIDIDHDDAGLPSCPKANVVRDADAPPTLDQSPIDRRIMQPPRRMPGIRMFCRILALGIAAAAPKMTLAFDGIVQRKDRNPTTGKLECRIAQIAASCTPHGAAPLSSRKTPGRGPVNRLSSL